MLVQPSSASHSDNDCFIVDGHCAVHELLQPRAIAVLHGDALEMGNCNRCVRYRNIHFVHGAAQAKRRCGFSVSQQPPQLQKFQPCINRALLAVRSRFKRGRQALTRSTCCLDTHVCFGSVKEGQASATCQPQTESTWKKQIKRQTTPHAV